MGNHNITQAQTYSLYRRRSDPWSWCPFTHPATKHLESAQRVPVESLEAASPEHGAPGLRCGQSRCLMSYFSTSVNSATLINARLTATLTLSTSCCRGASLLVHNDSYTKKCLFFTTPTKSSQWSATLLNNGMKTNHKCLTTFTISVV